MVGTTVIRSSNRLRGQEASLAAVQYARHSSTAHRVKVCLCTAPSVSCACRVSTVDQFFQRNLRLFLHPNPPAQPPAKPSRPPACRRVDLLHCHTLDREPCVHQHQIVHLNLLLQIARSTSLIAFPRNDVSTHVRCVLSQDSPSLVMQLWVALWLDNQPSGMPEWNGARDCAVVFANTLPSTSRLPDDLVL